MKITSNKLALITKMYCTLFGHEYQVSKKVTSHVKEYCCKYCKKELTTDSNGNLTELTPTFREINAILERIYQSKTERLKEKVINSSAYQQV
ncbi:hypothetical protein [Pseudotamlana carrageenivorans]|uniref:Prophage protein n=1 Tax=Pseudotamlana carrageenivorans TaxID=2069432 RepID=A0A2I7SI34_9FLAO|nr:hypothetical protein [Tamlana carrageenivorans]AUS05572.1 hypothetical protein C1A40_08900 [Tamlana carrageenivorans]